MDGVAQNDEHIDRIGLRPIGTFDRANRQLQIVRVIEPHAHPVHPPTIIPAGSFAVGVAAVRCRYAWPGRRFSGRRGTRECSWTSNHREDANCGRWAGADCCECGLRRERHERVRRCLVFVDSADFGWVGVVGRNNSGIGLCWRCRWASHVRARPPTEGGEDALIEGVLVRDGDCLFVGDGAPGTRFAVLWPFGTSWDEDAQEVVTAGGIRIRLGSMLSAGGGYGSPDTLQRLLDHDALRERADECAEGEFRELAYVQHSISTWFAVPAESADELEPLHQQAPVLELSVGSVPLVELSLGFEQWNDERAEPAEPEPEPRVGVVVSEGSYLTLEGRHPADATVTLFRLDESLRFVQDATLGWNGTDVTIPSPAVGTWFVDARAVFGSSSEYEGHGVLRSGAWLQVTPADAPCDTPSATPTLSPDSQVTGVVDQDGCPVVAADATLDLGALTPWFHCAPWPPVLTWGTGDDATMTRFWQYVYDPGEIVNSTAPDDAITTGRYITAGEILTSASNPDAIYIQTTNSSVQRWTAPEAEIGCA